MAKMTRRSLMTGVLTATLAAQIEPGFAAPALSLSAGGEPDRQASSNAWLEISPAAYARNLERMRRFLDAAGHSATEICAVIKADIYGHGISLLLSSLIEAKVPCLGFTGNEEAKVVHEFRTPGTASRFQGRLVRLRLATLTEISQAIGKGYAIEELIGNLALARQVNELGSAGNRIKAHLCLNSGGMCRNGLELSSPQGQADLKAIAKLDNLQIVAIMSHFPLEEDADVARHLEAFRADSQWIDTNVPALKSAKRHIANSYATLRIKDSHLDLVRVGGALVGDTAPVDFDGRPTAFERPMTFKSRVASVNFYQQGHTVSYGRTRTLTRDSRLANIPVGYSDGFRRDFSNLSYVLIRGHRVPLMGRVTMNTIMVDVTDYKDIVGGDEVVLFGRQGQNEITQAELEADSDTIGSEFMTVWGALNPKIVAAGG